MFVVTFQLTDEGAAEQVEQHWVPRIRLSKNTAVIVLAGHMDLAVPRRVTLDQCYHMALQLGSRRSPCTFVQFNANDTVSSRAIFEECARLAHLHARGARRRTSVVGTLQSLAATLRARFASARPRTHSHGTAALAAAFNEQYEEHALSSSVPEGMLAVNRGAGDPASPEAQPSDTLASATSTPAALSTLRGAEGELLDPSTLEPIYAAPLSLFFRLALPADAEPARPLSLPVPAAAAAPTAPRPATLPMAMQLGTVRGAEDVLLDASTMEPIYADPAALLDPDFYRMSRQARIDSLRRRRARPASPPISTVFPGVSTISDAAHISFVVARLQRLHGHGLFTTTSTLECIICYEQDINIAFLPCGHAVCCSRCFKMCERPCCPNCRHPVADVIKGSFIGTLFATNAREELARQPIFSPQLDGDDVEVASGPCGATAHCAHRPAGPTADATVTPVRAEAKPPTPPPRTMSMSHGAAHRRVLLRD